MGGTSLPPSGNRNLDDMAQRFVGAQTAIERAVRRHPEGFWHVYADGGIKKMWP